MRNPFPKEVIVEVTPEMEREDWYTSLRIPSIKEVQRVRLQPLSFAVTLPPALLMRNWALYSSNLTLLGWIRHSSLNEEELRGILRLFGQAFNLKKSPLHGI